MMIWTAVRQLSASPGAFIALGIVIIVVAAVWKLNSIFISPVLNLIVRDMVDVLQRNLGITKGNDKR